MAGLSRKKDYGSKRKPYPSVKASDFAAPGRKYPIPTEADAKDAAFLARIHHRPDVLKKIHQRYPNVMQDGGVTDKPLPENYSVTDTVLMKQLYPWGYTDASKIYRTIPDNPAWAQLAINPYFLKQNVSNFTTPDEDFKAAGILRDRLQNTPGNNPMVRYIDSLMYNKDTSSIKNMIDAFGKSSTSIPEKFMSNYTNEYGLGGWIKDNLHGVLGGLKVAGGIAALATGIGAPLGVGLLSSGAGDIVGEISRDQQAKQYEELQTQQAQQIEQAEKTSPLSYTNSFAPTFALGGLMPGMKPTAELEKEEVTEAPDGSMLKVNAPTHSQGGIDLPLQSGTRVFSDRLKTTNGKTYAEIADELRKKKAKYEKILNS